VFQAITEVFELRHLIGHAPQATVSRASLCLVIYDLLQLLRGYAARAAPEPAPAAALSAEQLFTDLHEGLVSLHRTLRLEEVLGALRPPPGRRRCATGCRRCCSGRGRWRGARR
jgi:hypothetical protein